MGQTVRVGAIQAEPVWWDLEGAVSKTIDLIQEAGAKGVKILAFPEVWLCGYPWPLWMCKPIELTPFIAQYIRNSMRVDSPEMSRIQIACREADIYIVLGYSERDGGSIYAAQAFISNTGILLHNRRKIKPTHVERSLWGDGQADSLTCVVDTPHGKLGALNCWENLQPLLRYNEYAQGVQIHVAAWPPVPWQLDEIAFPWPYAMTGEASYRISQVVAIEGQTFVLVSTQIVTEANHAKIGNEGKGLFKGDGGGFAMIFAPDGRPLAESLPAGTEGILIADIDLDNIDLAKNVCDPVGQYSRPDLLSLNVNRVPAIPVRDLI